MGNVYSENRICSCHFIGKDALTAHQTKNPHKISNIPTLAKSVEESGSSCQNIISASQKYLLKLNGNATSVVHSSEKTKSNVKDGKALVKCRSDQDQAVAYLKLDRDTSCHGNLVKSPIVLCDLSEGLMGLSISTNSKLNKTNGSGEPEEILEIPAVHYYGWFFSPETSDAINKVVMYYFKLCLKENSQFEKFILNCCKEADVRDPMELYNYKRPGKRIKPEDELEYHITAKFLGKVRDPHYQTFVRPYLDKLFYIHLVGIVFTPRTLGVRVKLTTAQQLLFDEKDERRNDKNLSLLEGTKNLIDQELESYSKLKRMHKENPKCQFKKDESKIAFKRLKEKEKTTGVITTNSRAHITIACAPNVKPKQTGDDLVDIIDLEQRPVTRTGNFQKDYEVKNGILRQFGMQGEAFVFYSDWEMIVPGKFNYL